MDTSARQSDVPAQGTKVSRRATLATAAWSVPVVAVATAAPAVAASPPFNPQSDLVVNALGGAEGRYTTGRPFTDGDVSPNTDFRRAFSVTNNGEGGFSGTLRIDFTFPRAWNQGISGNNVDAFSNWRTVDLGGSEGASVGSATPWTVSAGSWVQNSGTNAWTEVWFRMDQGYFTLNNVTLPPGGTIWFALNASIPFEWIRNTGDYLPNGRRIYWRSPVSITATTSTGTNLGTYATPVGGWTNGIWYFNGGGPYAYDGGHGLYPQFGTA